MSVQGEAGQTTAARASADNSTMMIRSGQSPCACRNRTAGHLRLLGGAVLGGRQATSPQPAARVTSSRCSWCVWAGRRLQQAPGPRESPESHTTQRGASGGLVRPTRPEMLTWGVLAAPRGYEQAVCFRGWQRSRGSSSPVEVWPLIGKDCLRLAISRI